MIRNIILDWSGTLVDDLPAVWEATNYVLQRAGIPEMTLDEFRSRFELPFTRFYAELVPGVSMPTLEEWFHGKFQEVQGTVTELPHAREFLEFCRAAGQRTFLLSTVRRDYFETQVAGNGYGQFFEQVYLGIRDKRREIKEILARHALDPHETLFVGDMQHDVDTAHHGGIHSCAVLTGYTGLSQLRRSEPELIVEHLGELRRILERDRFDWAPDRAHRGANHAPVATVGALIFNEHNEVLMVRTRKWSNRWGIPGGKIKYGEPSEAALRREILEETGLALKDIEFALVQDCIESEEFYRPAHFLLMNYIARCAETREVVLNDEAQEYRWLDLTEALRLDLNQPTQILIEAARERQTRQPDNRL